MERAYPLRRQDDPLEVVTLAFFEGDTEAIDAMHDDPHWMAGEERRLAGIAPLEQEIALTGGFEVGRGSSGGARRALTSIDRSHAYAKSA